MNRFAVFFLLVGVLSSCASSESTSFDSDPEFSPEEAQNAHPAQLYHYAGRLLEAGQMNEAAFWFYAGQLRYRVHLLARPDLPSDRDSALFASMNSVLGRTINEHLGANPDEWERVIRRVLNWDANTPNEFTPKNKYPSEYAQTRSGLTELLEMIKNNREKLHQAH